MDLTGELLTVLAGRYEIERELGRGGMAIVYLARDLKHRRLVALKVLRPELADSLGAERFLREIAIAAPLVHPNILALYDSGEASGYLYYVMPYVEGPTLRRRLDREVQLPIDEAIAIAREVAAALDYAHAHGVVHRDIKPDNILLCEGHVLVADFGLARAVSSAASTPLTRNMVIGTPAYMSPEQCGTDRAADARSDIYSLACVVFEMIAGMPPFRGATAQAVMNHQINDPPPSVCAERSTCPPALDEAVRRALAKVPADRFPTAGDFVRAMEAGGSAPAPPIRVPRRRLMRRRWYAIAAAALITLALPAWLAKRTTTAESDGVIATDTTRLALLPLEGASSAAAPENELLYEAFARWNGIVLVDPFQVTDAVRRRGRVVSEDDARAVARSLGAGRYVRGRLVRLGDSISVRAGLYDVDQPAPLQMVSVRTGLDESRNPRALYRLADSLLLRGMPADTPSVDAGRHPLAAVQAFAAAQRALDDFDLPKADSAFESARVLDPTFVRASLWLAQVRAWRELPPAAWRAAAESPARTAAEGARDRQLARGLLAMADGDFASACRTYDALRQRNPRDFAAWYGLGQCRTHDRVVVHDASAPAGWRFRSSQGAGLRAYETALKLLPSAHRGFQSEAFSALRELLLTDRDRLVAGYSLGADSARFLGRLSWLGDSITVVPYPWNQIVGGTPVYPPGFERAVLHQREVFRQIATTWAVALPGASAAKEALALSLEMLGDASAADTLRAARRLAAEPTRRLQLAAGEVLVRLKFAVPNDLQGLRATRVLADSLLGATVGEPMNQETARLAARVAEVTGKCERATALARQAAVSRTQPFVIPRHHDADAAELVTRASLGCQRAGGVSILGLDQRIASDPLFSPATRRMAEDVLLLAAAQLSFPGEPRAIAALSRSRAGTLIDAMSLVATDTADARKRLMKIDAGYGPRVPRIDAALPAARLWLQLRDTGQALALLRRATDGVSSYEPRGLAEQGRVGALVRAMALRAELERAHGDLASARALATSVVQLWSGADDGLQPLVKRMQSLTRS